LGNALISAAEALADSEARRLGPREIVLIGDLQGSQLNQLQGYEWPKGNHGIH
jgi:hypothetical protein